MIYLFWEAFALWSIFLLYLVAYDLPTCFVFVVVCYCPFIFIFLWILMLSCVFLSYIHSTPPGFLLLRTVKIKTKNTKKWKDKTKKDFGRMFVVLGGLCWVLTYELFVAGVLSFCFFFGGGGFCLSLSSLFQKKHHHHHPPPPKKKMKNTSAFNGFGCVVLFLRGCLLQPQKKPPTQKKQKKKLN